MYKKLRMLLQKAGMQQIDFNKKFIAIKIHFGEPGNLSYIRPNYAMQVVKEIKKLGGNPFLTDSNTLYSGRRSNALDHLDSAYENGFSPFSTGCHVVIADGLNGMDFREIDIAGEYCKSPKIGSAIADADVVISMNHFKGHEQTGFGGAMKNLGMGSGSIMGKKEMHSSSTPLIDKDNCTGCGVCIKSCRHGALSLDEDRKATINEALCVGCGQCIASCQFDAAQVDWNSTPDELNCRIAEYAKAVLKDKSHFHINFIMDVSPDCDCWTSNDIPIVQDIGIAASFDPVALDHACVDLVNQAPVIAGSPFATKAAHHQEVDKFKIVHPHTNWRSCLEHAEKIGVGVMDYELITVG
ncbi:MAG: DUF362 domain-containing protein [Dysgonamonadaceae bacterium]|jgi:uncharacterized Fe-S center protein|nr:DUF362 domain-containing protein [Dysgonamonadaceae bacterium]